MNTAQKPEQGSEEVMIRKAKRKFLFGCFLGVLGFAPLLAGAMLDVQTTWIVLVLVAIFFACEIAAIVLMSKSMPGLAISDINRIDQKYGECELTQLQNMKKYEVEQILRSHKFQYDDSGYYRRKKFSFLKDSVYYYVKIVDSSDMGKTIRNECNHFDKQAQNGKSACLILMIYSTEPTDENTELLRHAGMVQIADNMVLDMYSSKTVVVVGVDKTTNIGRYLDIGKGHVLYLYKYGCRMLKKLFG